ncbi:hypothetical protein K6V98_01185 [Collinsella sp. AGMB00827]|uniref:Uncharacterized protein n=1 Tax=Collinsella ureilytica TaxID=2869515 RepID=A0ABS7MI64_9ACTN|nr:hypothetical protein [Collinsella urealyticum]
MTQKKIGAATSAKPMYYPPVQVTFLAPAYQKAHDTVWHPSVPTKDPRQEAEIKLFLAH